MKGYFTLFIIFCFCFTKAQTVFNAELLYKLESVNESEMISALVLLKPNTQLSQELASQLQINYRVENIYSVNANKQSIIKLSRQNNVVRIEYAKHNLQLMNDTAHVRNRIRNIKSGSWPLHQSYDGTGVIVGIIDSGTDFNHPDFKDVNGQSRIKYLWDMTKPNAANTPTAFGYGQEWNNTQIDAGQCTHTDVAHFGHGTNTSGIAAGNGNSVNKYEGMAPKTDMIVVALDFDRNGHTIADAVQYIVAKSLILNKPLVINASVGDYYGSHDGTDLEAQMIDAMISNTPGRAMIASCGNGGAIAFHVGYNISGTDTLFTWIKNSSANFAVAEYADTNQIKNVMYSIGVTNTGYNDLAFTTFKPYNYALNTIKKDTLYHNSQRIGVVSSAASINSFGVYELYISIKADSLNYLWSINHTGTGRIDSWNFDYVKLIPQASLYPKIINYKKPDTLQTMVSSFQCSNEIVAVGNYINRSQYVNVNNQVQNTGEIAGSLHSTSSLGPTRDNRIKPEIVASGANILTCLPISMLPTYVTNFPTVVAQGGYHRTAGGTSSSSPVVAGLAALYFQKNPTATNQQLKQAIINCAYQDVFTSNVLPNAKWGYGKLDGFATMTCGEIFENVKVNDADNAIQVFPNPLSDQTNLLFSDVQNRSLKLYNASGQLVLEDVCKTSTYILKRNTLAAGFYFLMAEEKNKVYKIKIIIL